MTPRTESQDDWAEEERPAERNLSRLLLGCLIASTVGVLLLVGACVLGWGAFVRFGIATDLGEFIESIEEMELEPETRDELLQRLGALRERAREGDHTGFLTWLDYDTSIRSMLADGALTPEEQTRLSSELESLEQRN